MKRPLYKRPPKTEATAARPRRARRLGEGAVTLAIAALLGAAVLGAGLAAGGGRMDDVKAERSSIMTVRLPAADQARLNSWAEFFACHSLRSDQLIVATLRINDFEKDQRWRPDREIRVDLAPSADLSRYTPGELEVLREVSTLGSGSAADLAAACTAGPAAEPAAPAKTEAEP